MGWCSLGKKKLSHSPNLDITKELAAAERALRPAAERLKKALKGLKPGSLPIGALSDLLYQLRNVKNLVPSLSAPFDDVLRPVEKVVEEYFIQTLAVGESSGIQGMSSRTQITESVIPTVEDWIAFYGYVRKNNAFELLNRAVNREAVRERWEAKKQVPGVKAFHAKKVSCTKLSGKK